MADYHTVYKGPEGQTTQWEDIQRKLGNLPEKEPVWKPDAYTPEDEPEKDKEWLEGKDVDELEELEDEFADDRFLEEYRRRRIEELKQGATRPRFGAMQTITGNEFVAQVTNAGEGVWVICHLYQDRVADCAILNACLTELAERYPNTKFVKIKSTNCIPGYPDENLPTVLIYKDTKCLKSLVGLHHFGGKGTSPDKVALTLSLFGEDICGNRQERERQVEGLLNELLDLTLSKADRKEATNEGSDEDD